MKLSKQCCNPPSPNKKRELCPKEVPTLTFYVTPYSSRKKNKREVLMMLTLILLFLFCFMWKGPIYPSIAQQNIRHKPRGFEWYKQILHSELSPNESHFVSLYGTDRTWVLVKNLCAAECWIISYGRNDMFLPKLCILSQGWTPATMHIKCFFQALLYEYLR